jgi:hypothetical protein
MAMASVPLRMGEVRICYPERFLHEARDGSMDGSLSVRCRYAPSALRDRIECGREPLAEQVRSFRTAQPQDVVKVVLLATASLPCVGNQHEEAFGAGGADGPVRLHPYRGALVVEAYHVGVVAAALVAEIPHAEPGDGLLRGDLPSGGGLDRFGDEADGCGYRNATGARGRTCACRCR